MAMQAKTFLIQMLMLMLLLLWMKLLKCNLFCSDPIIDRINMNVGEEGGEGDKQRHLNNNMKLLISSILIK